MLLLLLLLGVELLTSQISPPPQCPQPTTQRPPNGVSQLIVPKTSTFNSIKVGIKNKINGSSNKIDYEENSHFHEWHTQSIAYAGRRKNEWPSTYSGSEVSEQAARKQSPEEYSILSRRLTD